MQRRAFGSGGWYATAGALAFLPPATRRSEKNPRSTMVETLNSPPRHRQSPSGTYSSATIGNPVANSFRIVLGTEPSHSSCSACTSRCHRGDEKKRSWYSFGGGKARPKGCKVCRAQIGGPAVENLQGMAILSWLQSSYVHHLTAFEGASP
jgi:hypothetical protein